MEKSGLKDMSLKVGWFDIKAGDVVVVDIVPTPDNLWCKHLDFARGVRTYSEDVTVVQMVHNLNLRGINIDKKIQKLILSGYFNLSLSGLYHQMFEKVAVIKGKTTNCRYISTLVKDKFPDDVYLIPPEITFQVAYLVSHIFSKEFLNIHNMNRIYIMSKPIEQLDKNDDDLVVVWDPDCGNRGKVIRTDLYNNPYTGDRTAGYLFFTV